MALEIPENMDDLVYFTRRNIGDGKAMVWVWCKKCPNCNNGLMRKPIDEKTGKFKTRADTYVCQECKHEEPKTEVESELEAHAVYTCPECKKQGEGSIPFKRKNYLGVKSLVFECEHCTAKIPVTKKMKDIKKK